MFSRIAAAAPFAGIRRFHEGRGFKQWTGDDSKALMKVGFIFVKFPHIHHHTYITAFSACNSRPCPS
jgi:hypothetical protein